MLKAVLSLFVDYGEFGFRAGLINEPRLLGSRAMVNKISKQ